MRMASLLLALAVAIGLPTAMIACDDTPKNMFDLGPPPDLLPPPEDAAPYVPACDPIGQTGCGTGEHCTVAKVNGAPMEACIPTPKNPIPAGQTCTPLQLQGTALVGDSCEPGTACVGLINVFKCRPFCFTHADCAAGTACVAPTGSPLKKMISMDFQPSLSSCAIDEGCDPVAQTVCGTGLRCMISRADTNEKGEIVSRITFCGMASGALINGGSCASSADCAPGFRCSGLGFCRKLCYVMDVPDGGNATAGMCPGAVVCGPIAGTDNVYGECD